MPDSHWTHFFSMRYTLVCFVILLSGCANTSVNISTNVSTDDRRNRHDRYDEYAVAISSTDPFDKIDSDQSPTVSETEGPQQSEEPIDSENEEIPANDPGEASETLLSDDPSKDLVRIIRAVDGDTIEIERQNTKEVVRLIGIDTPESAHPTKSVQCFGLAAKSFTAAITKNQTVRLQGDALSADRDRYGRLLRYVFLEDGRLLNALLIQEGYGYAYTVFPFQYEDDFALFQEDARQEEKGLWAPDACDKNTQSSS